MVGSRTVQGASWDKGAAASLTVVISHPESVLIILKSTALNLTPNFLEPSIVHRSRMKFDISTSISYNR